MTQDLDTSIRFQNSGACLILVGVSACCVRHYKQFGARIGMSKALEMVLCVLIVLWRIGAANLLDTAYESRWYAE
jgi:hypothetical protein